MDWYTINEKDWTPYLGKNIVSLNFKVKRIYPDSREYKEIVSLRYKGLSESGFINPNKHPKSIMKLSRDRDSIVLGLYNQFKLLGTVTLNTITDNYPGMAMELEKKVTINHPFYKTKDVLEITKLSVINQFRTARVTLNLFLTTIIIAKLLNKNHFWQVSRFIPRDIKSRESFGFDYTSVNYIFDDPSLNNMKSAVGYCYFPEVLTSPNISPLIRSLYASILEMDFPILNNSNPEPEMEKI